MILHILYTKHGLEIQMFILYRLLQSVRVKKQNNKQKSSIYSYKPCLLSHGL